MKREKIEWPAVADYGLCQKGINPADEGKICIIEVSPAILDDFYALGIDFSQLESLHDQWMQDHDICYICSKQENVQASGRISEGSGPDRTADTAE